MLSDVYFPRINGVSTSIQTFRRDLASMGCSSVLIAPSSQLADVLRAYGVRTEIRIIPTGLDMRRFARGDGDRFRAQFGIGSDRPVALTVGRVAFEKNIGFLISVLEHVRRSVPEILFVIAGEGPALLPLQRRVTESGLAENVSFVGYLDRESSLLDCYRSAEVFMFASRTETQGLVLLEAMALGVPVVSTAVLGTKTVLESARGAIVVEEHEQQFADAVVRVLTDPQVQSSLAAQTAQHVQINWSSAEMSNRMHELYRRVASAAPAGAAQEPALQD